MTGSTKHQEKSEWTTNFRPILSRFLVTSREPALRTELLNKLVPFVGRQLEARTGFCETLGMYLLIHFARNLDSHLGDSSQSR